ncbi:MAG: hypothetical protein CVV44_21650 [Spirochaetae bacterium HGW-Spirochaetae-1]|jgi:NAD(P)-dependent dehydrogenase (short-subunit alcohol dehydrogenase family)|nr:MAG: hypothetical protein CVV44_21650 [Spirochaetae bacterium HGW-Spirochaetae-1]
MKQVKLQDAVICITGASSGIGWAAAKAFDRAGARLSLVARRKERLAELASELRDAIIIPADMSDASRAASMIEETVRHFGRIDILVNNAAAIIVSRADETGPDDLHRSFATNLVGPLVAVNTALPYMRRQGYGHIINVGSPGFLIGVPCYTSYVCSKAAMSAWTRTIQAEWADTGIVVSEYFPGYIKTDSPPESRYTGVEQSLVIDPDANAVTRFFTRPKSADDVAGQLVKLAQRPRLLKHSGIFVPLGAVLSLIPRIRLSIARDMAVSVRKRLGLSIFSTEE